MTKNQIASDWETVEWGSIAQKKEIAARYSSPSSKSADLKKVLAQAMSDIRKRQTEFTQDDIMWFGRLEYNQKTLRSFLMNEPEGFVKLYIDTMEQRAKKSGNSIAGNHARKNAEIARTALCEITKTVEEKSNDAAKENALMNIRKMLAELMHDFKVEYMKRVKNSAIAKWESLPAEIERLKKLWIAESERVDKYIKENKLDIWARTNAWRSVDRAKNRYDRSAAILRRFETEKQFVDDCLKHAEEHYEANLNELADRIGRQGLDISKLKVDNVKDDPKYFSMMVSDGERKLYCRSILAAQWSDKMVPHFRFIMTDRK